MRTETTDSCVLVTYDSVHELAEHAASTNDAVRQQFDEPSWTANVRRTMREFYAVKNIDEAVELAREGWAAEVTRALEVSDAAVEKVERTFEQLAFTAEFDVSGCEVDVARYLDGTPENMIDYPLREIVKAGKVITLCLSVSYSGAVSSDAVIRRGHAVAALVLALSRLGYATEIWTDWSLAPGDNTNQNADPNVRIRTLVKGPQDALDVEEMMFAVAHPAYKRVLHFAVVSKLPEPFRSDHCHDNGTISQSYSLKPVEDLPEGTIYTHNIRSDRDVPDADEQLIAWLKQLEIVTDSD